MKKEELLIKFLDENKKTLSTAESCTGGLIASTIVSVSGSSKVYNQGFVTYSNDAKMKYLNVSKETLDNHGAVSEETVIEMAFGCAKESNSDMAIVSSGIAGPLGGSRLKPVGLVYIGVFYNGEVKVYKNIFKGDRNTIRNEAAYTAIGIALDMTGYKC